MNKLEIRKEFIKRDIVEDTDRLDEYLGHCFSENQNERLRCNETDISLTEEHHILPASLFSEHKDLKLNEWNSTHLKRIDHLYVHFLLALALKENNGMLTAFSLMSDTRLSKNELLRTNFNELVNTKLAEEVYKRGKLESGLKGSKTLNEVQENGMTRSQEIAMCRLETMGQLQENGLTGHQNAVRKGIETKNIIQENGLSGHQNATRKANKTKDKIQENGLTGHQNAILKMSKTRNTIQDNGNTINQNSGLKGSKTLSLKGKWFNIFNYKGEIIHENVPNRIIHNHCQVLLKATKEKPVGLTERSKITLNKANNIHLVNHYVEEVFLSEEIKLKQLEKEIMIFDF